MFNATFHTASHHLARREAQRVSSRCQHYGGSRGTPHRDILLDATPVVYADPWEATFCPEAMEDPRLSQTASVAAGILDAQELEAQLSDLATVGDFLEAPLASSVLAHLDRWSRYGTGGDR